MILVGADLTAIAELRGMRLARTARVAGPMLEATNGRWGHAPVRSAQVVGHRQCARGAHAPTAAARTCWTRANMDLRARV